LIGAMKNEKERMSTTQTIYERLDLNQIWEKIYFSAWDIKNWQHVKFYTSLIFILFMRRQKSFSCLMHFFEIWCREMKWGSCGGGNVWQRGGNYELLEQKWKSKIFQVF
jgi:hypothetical protein